MSQLVVRRSNIYRSIPHKHHCQIQISFKEKVEHVRADNVPCRSVSPDVGSKFVATRPVA